MSKQIPKIFYKYRCFDGRSISMLANDQIYFASPLEFNDPFDCKQHEHIFNEFREESFEQLARLDPTISLTAITPENTQRLIKVLKQHPIVQQINMEQKAAFKEFAEKQGILALSARNDSILMWSHYAEFHKGFCIGFKNTLAPNSSNIIEVTYTENRNNCFYLIFLLAQIHLNKVFTRRS